MEHIESSAAQDGAPKPEEQVAPLADMSNERMHDLLATVDGDNTVLGNSIRYVVYRTTNPGEQDIIAA